MLHSYTISLNLLQPRDTLIPPLTKEEAFTNLAFELNNTHTWSNLNENPTADPNLCMYDIHIRPTGPNGNRGKLILLFVYGSRFTIVFQVARRCASASMSANGIVWQSMRRLPSGYWVPFTVRAIRARRTTLLSGMCRMCPRYRNLRCRIARTRSNTGAVAVCR